MITFQVSSCSLLQQHQVVAMDDLFEIPAAQDLLKLAAAPAPDALQRRAVEVRQSAGQEISAAEHVHGVTETERAAHLGDAAGQQAAAPPERTSGTFIHQELTSWRLLRQPGLARRCVRARQDAGSPHLTGSQRLERGPATTDDQRLDARL